MSDYSIPKPTLSPAAWALGGAVIIGLIGLGAVAFHVFSMVDPWPVALAFAAVIEAGAAVECLSILRGNRWAVAGAVISLAVSGSYNVTRITRAGLDLPIAEAAALAIGPLSAVLFLALSLAHELHQHEAAVKGWQEARQAWQDDQARTAALRQAEAEERSRQAEAERLERENRAALEAERLRLEYENRERERLDRRERARERAAARANVPPAFSGTGENVPPTVPPAPGNVPPTKGTYQDYTRFMSSNGANHSRRELAEKFGVSERCVTKWRARYDQEHPAPTLAELVN
jgi:hypothetical protein